MKFSFVIKDDGSLPVVYIDDARLSVISLTYAWETKTDKVGSGANVCIVDGYFENSTVSRRFVFNILTGIVTEESLEATSGRIFEVCVNIGTTQEMEKWAITPFLDLKVGDMIRIKDAGQYHRDLDGCGVWTVTDTTRLTKGFIDILPYTHDAEVIV